MSFPKQGDFFRMTLKSGDCSWNNKLWLCIGATDDAVQGVMLDDMGLRGKPIMHTRADAAFIEAGPFFGHMVLNR